jgi:hypothetical protein
MLEHNSDADTMLVVPPDYAFSQDLSECAKLVQSLSCIQEELVPSANGESIV